MKKFWDFEEDYDTVNERSYTNNYNSENVLFRVLKKRRRIIQTVVALLLFIVISGTGLLDNLSFFGTDNAVSFYLTDSRSDLSGNIIDGLEDGIWSDTFERGVRETFFDEESTSIPTTGPNQSIMETMAVPISGTIIRDYGWEETTEGEELLHPGIDILPSGSEKKVKAVLGGEIIDAGENERLGEFIELNHGSGIISVYGNCGTVLAEAGEKVKRGEVIAELEDEEEAYLHFELRYNGKPIDPKENFEDIPDM